MPKNITFEKFERRMWDFSSEMDKVVYGLLRQTLGLQKKTTRLGMLAEVGKHPLSMRIYIQTMKYYVRLLNTESKLLQNALLEATKRYQEGKGSWIQQIVFLRKATNLENKFELVKNPTSFNTKFKKALHQKFDEYWQEERKTDGKLRFYFEHKKDFKYENYLDLAQKDHRIAISRLRLSSHKLPIEQMRIQKVNREERVCPICESGEVGNEWHYLENCDNGAMRDIRVKFREEVEDTQTQFKNFSLNNILHYCLRGHDKETFTPLGKYVHNVLHTYDEEVERQIEEATNCSIM